MPAHPEPSQPILRPRLRRRGWAALAGAVAIVVVTIAAARREPGWYAARLAAGEAATADRDARRLVTSVAGLRTAVTRPGDWDIAVREEEINAWLATDLERNHAQSLPAGVSAPRVRLEPGRIHVAARAALGVPLALAIDVRLRSPERLECAVAEARIGAIPLPTGPFVHRLAALCDRLGMPAEVRRLDGRGVIVVFWGGRGVVLHGLSVNTGELVVAGTTGEKR